MQIINNDIKLSILEDKEENYKLLEKWCSKEEIYIHFEQRILTYEEIVNKYKSRCSENSKVPVYMIYYKDKKIGIIQYKKVEEVYDLDIFIGELNLHNKKIGEKVINLISNYLINKKGAKELTLTPLSDNTKAIKCYQKCGYRIMNEFEAPNTIGEIKKYVMMKLEVDKNE